MPTKTENFEELLKEYFAQLPDVGDLVKGSVVSIDSGIVRIDIKGVTTGIVRGRELFAESTEYSNISIGDEAEATVLEVENETGEMELSFRAAGHQRVWNKMSEWMTDGVTIDAKIVSANKGGLLMKVDALPGFLPVSQLAPDNYPRVQGGDKNRILEILKEMVGRTLQVKVIDVNEKDEKLIVSEKAVWEDDQKAVLDQYKIGQNVDGEISALTSFGAFVKFGEGLEGLVHISEIVWQRIDHPKDILKIGDKVTAQIIDLNKSKIYLSMKRLINDPWKSVKDKYSVGQVLEAQVHKIEPFGLMVKLDEQIHGLAHISELSSKTIKGLDELKEMFNIGQPYKFEIVSIEPAEHRLGLKIEGVQSKVREEKPKKEKKEVKKEEASDSAKATSDKEAPAEEEKAEPASAKATADKEAVEETKE